MKITFTIHQSELQWITLDKIECFHKQIEELSLKMAYLIITDRERYDYARRL